MKKRTFLKTSSALALGSMVAPVVSCTNSNTPVEEVSETMVRTNWSGNLKYNAKNYYEPKTIDELQDAIKKANKVRVVGSQHCFNKIADTPYTQISSVGLPKEIQINTNDNTVTVNAGASYGHICKTLYDKGYALHNLASLPHISIGGACATATHGSGVGNSNLGSAASAIEFLDASGTLHTLSRKVHGDQFIGATTHLGALGFITKITLDLLPKFDVRQDNYQFLPETELVENFEAIMSSGYSVSLFTDYKTDTINQVWIKTKIGTEAYSAPAEFYGAKAATKNIHPIVEISAENCTDQMGVPGPWYNRLPHFKMDFMPSSGEELQAEYFVPMEHAVEAYKKIKAMRDLIGPYLMISEIRTIAADEQWMSPFYQQASVAFHFTCLQDWAGLKKVLPVLEKELEPFRVRPHWGKMFTMEPALLQGLIPKLNDFKNLVAEYDPDGKFRNDFVQRNLYN